MIKDIIKFNSNIIQKIGLDNILAREEFSEFIKEELKPKNIKIDELLFFYDEEEKDVIEDELICQTLNIINGIGSPDISRKLSESNNKNIDLLGCLLNGNYYTVLFTPEPFTKEDMRVLVAPESFFCEIGFKVDDEIVYLHIIPEIDLHVPKFLCDKYRNIYLENLKKAK